MFKAIISAPAAWGLITAVLAGFGVPPDVADAAKTIAENGQTIADASATVLAAGATIVTAVQAWKKRRDASAPSHVSRWND